MPTLKRSPGASGRSQPAPSKRAPARQRSVRANNATKSGVSRSPKASEPRGERGGIQSLERAAAILEEIAAHPEGIALADLCRNVGLHSSTTFHLVRTLVQLGFASQLPESRKYRIGRKLFSLAAGALDENELVARATPLLEVLADQTGETSHFAIRSGDEIVIVARIDGPGMFQVANHAGGVRPGNATAIGKVLLASLAPEQLERWFAGAPLQRLTPKTIVERDELLTELADVRRSGIAFDDGEYSPELRCLAVPVYDFRGRIAGAIGISGPMWRLSLKSLQDKSRQVFDVAARLSAELGYHGAKPKID